METPLQFPSGTIVDIPPGHEITTAPVCRDAFVYVVRGSSYSLGSDESWDAAAFLQEQAANAFRELLNNWCKEQGLLFGQPITGRPGTKCPHDPGFAPNHRGADYKVVPIPLKG